MGSRLQALSPQDSPEPSHQLAPSWAPTLLPRSSPHVAPLIGSLSVLQSPVAMAHLPAGLPGRLLQTGCPLGRFCQHHCWPQSHSVVPQHTAHPAFSSNNRNSCCGIPLTTLRTYRSETERVSDWAMATQLIGYKDGR